MPAPQVHVAAVKGKAWFQFSIADGGLLELGGAAWTAAASKLSSDATFTTTNPIPQNNEKTAYDDVHYVKHADIKIISCGATTPAARYAIDGSTPTTALGTSLIGAGDGVILPNSRNAIFNFKLFNRSGGAMVIEVRVDE